jgi:bifunctional non-homologous end joining protein LigD
MPERVEPCLALLVSKPPNGPEWVYEIKWDGYRLAVHIEPQGVRILTRGGHDWTRSFPAIAEAAREIGGTAILDGEAVVLDASGRSNFGALQQALGGRGWKRSASEAIF